ncbi:MAG: lipoyl(octanoyl) transferase LipB [Wenzhouxiangella sp.]|nr:lipoyl(octanoyl) transferase LipB [Wenzhouxiangella sp.]
MTTVLADRLEVKQLGRRPYAEVFQAMRDFTDRRTSDTADQLWLVEHDPVFTQGLAGRPEHLLVPGDIPVVQTDRGGQVTYHGPGQLVIYPLLDLERRRLGIRCLVDRLEQAVIDVLAGHDLCGRRRDGMPGVYIDDEKIASIGLKVRRGCCYHGLAVNVAMDLSPFARINPCGYAGLEMTQLSEWVTGLGLGQTGVEVVSALCRLLDYHPVWSEPIRDEN